MNAFGQIGKGALLSYISILFSILSGLIYTPWMVRQIGKSDYGLYILVTSFLTYFVIDFGLGQAIATFISKYNARNEGYKTKRLLGIATRIYFIIDVIIFLTLFFLYFFIEEIFTGLNETEISKFRVIYCIAGLFSFLSFPFTPLNGILISYERFTFLKICDVIQRTGTIALMVLALFLDYRLYALVLINALVGLIVIAIKTYYIRKTMDIELDIRYRDVSLVKQLFGFSVWVTIIGIAQRLLINVTPTLLAVFSDTSAIAIFAVGSVIEGYIWTFASALNGLFLPRVANLSEASKDRGAITNLMIKVGRIQLFVIGLFVIAIITLGIDFIRLWMGDDFSMSYWIALFLILPGTIKITQEIASTLVFIENKVKYSAFIYLLSSIASVSISIILIPYYGSLGAAIGISTGIFFFQIIGMNLLYYREMKIDIFLFFKETFFKMAIPLTLSLLLGFYISHQFVISTFIDFSIQVLLLGVSYFFLMWLLALNSFEKSMIREVLNKVVFKDRLK